MSNLYMLARNRVEDFDRWMKVFKANTDADETSGLTLEKMWRDADDPINVFFIFAVADRAQAQAFGDAPAAAESGEVSGVIDGEYHYVTSYDGYP